MAAGKIIWHAHQAGLEIKFEIPKSDVEEVRQYKNIEKVVKDEIRLFNER